MATATSQHRMILEDRGREHVYRWVAKCSCGEFTSARRRRKQEVVEMHRIHLDTKEQAGKPMRGKRHDRPMLQPAALTPYDDLPEELR